MGLFDNKHLNDVLDKTEEIKKEEYTYRGRVRKDEVEKLLRDMRQKTDCMSIDLTMNMFSADEDRYATITCSYIVEDKEAKINEFYRYTFDIDMWDGCALVSKIRSYAPNCIGYHETLWGDRVESYHELDYDKISGLWTENIMNPIIEIENYNRTYKHYLLDILKLEKK